MTSNFKAACKSGCKYAIVTTFAAVIMNGIGSRDRAGQAFLKPAKALEARGNTTDNFAVSDGCMTRVAAKVFSASCVGDPAASNASK